MNASSEVFDPTHYMGRIDSIRDLVYNYQLLQLEFHKETKRVRLMERMFHFSQNLAQWKNFGFTWMDLESGLFELQEVQKPLLKKELEVILNDLIEDGSFASALQLSRALSIPYHQDFLTLAPIRAGNDIKGVFMGIRTGESEKNLEFEHHFLCLALNSLGGALRRIESHGALTSSNEDLGKIILKKITESEEARVFAEATTRRMTDFFNLFHNEVFNSLNGVLGFTQLMLEEVQNEEQREHLDFILKSGNHLKTVSNEFQRPRTVVEGVLSVDIRAIHFHRMWENFSKMSTEWLKERGRAGVWNSQFPEDFHMDLDELRLRQILLSMLSLMHEKSETGELIHIRGEYIESRHELSFTFQSPSLARFGKELDFTVYAPLIELLKINRSLEIYSFEVCRSIAKMEDWIFEFFESSEQESFLLLRMNVTQRSRYEQL